MVRRTLSEPKVGHLGTLDPGATGLLVLAVGSKALKMVEFFQSLSKEYEADVRFGAVSSTYDADGTVEPLEPKPGWSPPDLPVLRRTIEDRFTGTIDQVPPAYSAVHVNGQRAYDLARKGQTVTIAARPVQIAACEVLSYEYPNAKLRVACGSGTYIRSLAHDLGQVFRCGAYLEALRRTRVGDWTIESSVKADSAKWTDVLPLKESMTRFPGIDIDASDVAEIRFGRKIKKEVKPDTIAWHDGLPVAVLMPAKDGSRMAQPRKVL
jgi:tRNA pseudouridine55 synthase